MSAQRFEGRNVIVTGAGQGIGRAIAEKLHEEGASVIVADKNEETASKGAVFAFTRSLATEVGAHGITVNAVAPGLTASEGVMASPHAEAFDFVVSLQSIPRRAVPADIAPAVAFLASEEAHWITGQMLTADGGHTRH